ncbi:hypothetical protein A2U01_0086654 [Trifolium medium]|uniref:Uncharacterized protein n=1 Tax=Trifolium medium TaxID=97028 RepID=A0A392TZ60_9FABA|nr:hypothetical protein [Trifolium medium]
MNFWFQFPRSARTSEPQRDKTDKIQIPGEEHRASSLSDRVPSSASIQNPGTRSARLSVA